MALVIIVFGGLFVRPAVAQELEPRRWSHLPEGVSFAGMAYAFTDGEVVFDPILRLEDVTMEMHTVAVSYLRTFSVFDHSARIELTQAYQHAEWEGFLNDTAASTSRTGFSDSVLRFSVNLHGGPPLMGEDFAAYRAKVAVDGETIVGAGLGVQIPTGEYFDDRLLNLGSNRFTFRPQFGVVRNRGNWSAEMTTSCWIFTENDDFFGGNQLELDPLYGIQGHLVYTFRPGFWLSAGVAYGIGAESTLNGESKDDRKQNLVWGSSVGYSFTPQFGVKVGYIGVRSLEDVGSDSDSVIAAFSVLW